MPIQIRRRSRARGSVICGLLLAAVLPGAVAAPPPAASDAWREEIAAVLLHARVDVSMDDVPVRAALRQFAAAVGLTVIGRYDDHERGVGLDPDRPVSLTLRDAPAVDALEMIIDQAAQFAACDWQIRTGYVEVGTRRRLCWSTDQRTHSLDGLLIDAMAPDDDRHGFGPGRNRWGEHHFNTHAYRSASVRVGAAKPRYTPDDLAEEFIRIVAEVIEPGNWDFELRQAPPTGGKPPFGTPPYRSSDHRVARITRFDRGRLVIDAPGFIHRQIAGLTAPASAASSIIAKATPQSTIRLVRIDDAEATRDEPAGAGAPPVGPLPIRPAGDDFRRRTMAALDTRRFDFIVDADLHTAFEIFEQRLGIPVIVRYHDDAMRSGVDPSLPVRLSLRDMKAGDVLALLLDVCGSDGTDCRWQVRRGYLEVGSRERLSVPAARTLRLYSIRDLMLDLGDPGRPRRHRKLPDGMAVDRVEQVVTTIEPEAWDWGQIEYYEDDRVRPAAAPRRSGGGDADPAVRPERPAYVASLKPAIIRHWRDVLIVYAPDYIHRQLGPTGRGRHD